MHPIDLQLLDTFVEIRNDFVNQFIHSNQYGQLTHSYAQKPFTIFNLLISSICSCDGDEHNKLQIIPVSITQNELIETQLNIKYLLLNRSILQKLNVSYEFSRYEIELVRFLEQNDNYRRNAIKLLPSIQNLYYIIDHPHQFYPFGVIKAYEILSMLITNDGEFQEASFELKELSINELEGVIQATRQEDDVDEVAEAMWKFVIAHLNHCEINSSSISAEQISNVIVHLRSVTCCYRSSDLRGTAIEMLAVIIKYFKDTQPNLTLLIEFAELLLSLLRDDDANVRNRTSEIVMDLIGGNENQSQFVKGKLRLNIYFGLCLTFVYFNSFQSFRWLLKTISSNGSINSSVKWLKMKNGLHGYSYFD